MNKHLAISLLEKGLNRMGNPGYLYDFFADFEASCEFIELIPLLKQVANEDRFYYVFDNNGAGGFPRGTGEGESFRDRALEAIEVIQKNYEKLTPTAKLLKSTNPKTIESALDELIKGDSIDKSLIPILENIAKEDVYLVSSGVARGFRSQSKRIYLGEKANKAIQKIKENKRK